MKVRYLFFLLIVVHGLIHVMGFAKAFRYAEISQLTQPISRTAGACWLLCAFTFAAAGGLFLLKPASWWWIALPAIVLSQALIFASWGDAKFGTAANLIARSSALQKADLPGVMRFVLADVEPFAQIVSGPPRPIAVDRHQPLVVAFAEFGERFLAALLK